MEPILNNNKKNNKEKIKERKSIFSKKSYSNKSINRSNSSSSSSFSVSNTPILYPIIENEPVPNKQLMNDNISISDDTSSINSNCSIAALDPECLNSTFSQVKDLIHNVVKEKTNQELINELLAFRFLIEKFNVLIKVNNNEQDEEISKKIKIISMDLKSKIEKLEKVKNEEDSSK